MYLCLSDFQFTIFPGLNRISVVQHSIISTWTACRCNILLSHDYKKEKCLWWRCGVDELKCLGLVKMLFILTLHWFREKTVSWHIAFFFLVYFFFCFLHKIKVSFWIKGALINPIISLFVTNLRACEKETPPPSIDSCSTVFLELTDYSTSCNRM